MATVLKVSTAEIQRVSGEYNRIYGEVNNLTDNMLSLVTALRGIWEGEAAEAFIAKAMGLENDINQIKTMIQGHERELEEVAGIFDKAEMENVNGISALPGDVI